MPVRSNRRFTYSNVVSTLALFLALTGGVVYAAQKIGTKSIKRHAVVAKKLAPDSVKEGKLVDGAVTNAKLVDDSIEPGKLTFPVFYVAEPSGGSAPVTSGPPEAYPLQGATWEQEPGAVQVVFGEAKATLAYDGDGSGSCQAFFDIRLNGQQVGGGQIGTGSTTPERVTASLGAQPTVDPETVSDVELTIQIGSNGDCEGGSRIDSSRFKILNFG
jgi:hypothetical protein